MDDDDYRTESEFEADSDREDEDHEVGGWLGHFESTAVSTRSIHSLLINS